MYILDSTTIRRPLEINESNNSQFAVNRTLDGSINRDYFGANKRSWTLEYSNVKKADYDTIKAIYDNYISTGNAKTWEITETNYTVSSTNVHVDLFERDFNVRGEDYISDFTLILTEV
jgi:hypothetical protein